MALTEEQKQFIVNIDFHINQILSEGGDDTDLLLFFADLMQPEFEEILHSSEEGELDLYCEEYPSFYQLMRALERLTGDISQKKLSFSH